MSKKHFRVLAIELHAVKPETDDFGYSLLYAQWGSCVDAVADVCSGGNHRFDRARFLEACENGLPVTRVKDQKETP